VNQRPVLGECGSLFYGPAAYGIRDGLAQAFAFSINLRMIAKKLNLLIMPFFKTARDQMKTHALVAHLERAKARISPGLYETALSLRWAQKAMEKVKKAKAEYFFSRNGWLHVVEICEVLAKAAREARREDLNCICRSIYEWALDNEDRIEGGGLRSVVRSAWEAMDEGEVVAAMEELAASMDAQSQFEFAMLFTTDDGSDEQKAAYWFEQSAAKGHADAQYNLAVMCLKGDGTPKNEEKALEWFEKSAAQGDARAQFNLGVMYSKGTGITKDEHKAVEWFEKAAAQGLVNAQLNLARMHECGQGISKNEQKAAELYGKAAAQGSRNAQFNLGVMYANGCGVSKNESKAAELYEQAAAKGYASAFYNLAHMYAAGLGVPKDDDKAYIRFSVAAALGHKSAGETLRVLDGDLSQAKKNELQALVKQILESLPE
jgi:TPR repeat protein